MTKFQIETNIFTSLLVYNIYNTQFVIDWTWLIHNQYNVRYAPKMILQGVTKSHKMLSFVKKSTARNEIEFCLLGPHWNWIYTAVQPLAFTYLVGILNSSTISHIELRVDFAGTTDSI